MCTTSKIKILKAITVSASALRDEPRRDTDLGLQPLLQHLRSSAGRPIGMDSEGDILFRAFGGTTYLEKIIPFAFSFILTYVLAIWNLRGSILVT